MSDRLEALVADLKLSYIFEFPQLGGLWRAGTARIGHSRSGQQTFEGLFQVAADMEAFEPLQFGKKLKVRVSGVLAYDAADLAAAIVPDASVAGDCSKECFPLIGQWLTVFGPLRQRRSSAVSAETPLPRGQPRLPRFDSRLKRRRRFWLRVNRPARNSEKATEEARKRVVPRFMSMFLYGSFPNHNVVVCCPRQPPAVASAKAPSVRWTFVPSTSTSWSWRGIPTSFSRRPQSLTTVPPR